MSTTQQPVGPPSDYHPPPPPDSPPGRRWAKIAIRVGVPALIVGLVRTSEIPQGKAVKVSTGQLKGLAGQRGSGAASIVRTPNGSHVVKLEDYDVSSGITLFLYVVPGADQEEPGSTVSTSGDWPRTPAIEWCRFHKAPSSPARRPC